MKTKLLISTIIFALALAGNSAHAQAPDYEWAISAKGKGYEKGFKITTDSDGNVIVTGSFQSKEIMFDTIRLINSDQDSSTFDVFIVKYSPEAKVLWAKSFGGYGEDMGRHCATDQKGNIVLVGGYDCEQLTIGDYKFTNKTNKGEGSDIFIVKFSPNGDIIWAKSMGGPKHDGKYDTCVIDEKENIFITGSFYSKSFPLDSIVLTNSDRGGETFIAKFSSEGKLLWAKSAQGLLNDMTQSCALDPQGNLIIAGYFTGATIIFDSITLKNSGEKTPDIFVAKYSSRGKLIWAKSFGGPSLDIATCAVDVHGNILLAGVYADSILTFGNTILYNNGEYNIMVAKLNPDGKVLWAKSAGGKSADGVRNFCVDENDNIIVTGSFQSPTLTIGNTTLTKDTILTDINSKTQDMFIAAYSPDGEVLWAKSAGGSGRNVGRSCASDKKGNIYWTGSFDTTLLTLGSLTLSNSGDSDIFILKLSKNR